MEYGQINLIIGCMFSGKSTEIIKLMKRYTVLNKKILAINHMLDKRYTKEEESCIVTHDKLSYNCIFTEKLLTLKDNIRYKEAEILVVEEAQFFGDLFNFVVGAADNDGKIVIVAGLDGDYKKEAFGDILKLIPHAEKVTKLHALCLLCGDGTNASFTKRITDSQTQTLIGSGESYIAVCRKHFI